MIRSWLGNRAPPERQPLRPSQWGVIIRSGVLPGAKISDMGGCVVMENPRPWDPKNASVDSTTDLSDDQPRLC